MPELELPALTIESLVLITAAPALVVINRDPGPGEAGVPLDTGIALEVAALGASELRRGSVRVWVGGVLAFQGGATPEVAPAFAGPRARVTELLSVLRVVLDPLAPFASLATVSVRVLAETEAGAGLDELYSFFIEDRTAPRVVGAEALGQKRVRVVFDEAIQCPEGASVTFLPQGAPAVGVTAVALASEGSVVEITLSTEMTPEVAYQVVVRGILDRAGNPVLPPFDRAVFPGFRPARPAGRRFSLWELLPQHSRRDDPTGDLARFIGCLDEVTALLLTDLDRSADHFDLERAPERLLERLLQDLGNPFPFEITLLQKRRLASLLVEMYQEKGTAPGIQNAIRFFLGVEARVVPFHGESLRLGEARVGEDWILGPSRRFALYAFNVALSRAIGPTEARALRALVELLKPGHTHLVDLVEPPAPEASQAWVLGEGELGKSTRLD